MDKNRKFQCKDWIEWQKAIESWEKEEAKGEMVLHSEHFIDDLIIQYLRIIQSRKGALEIFDCEKAFKYVGKWLKNWIRTSMRPEIQLKEPAMIDYRIFKNLNDYECPGCECRKVAYDYWEFFCPDCALVFRSNFVEPIIKKEKKSYTKNDYKKLKKELSKKYPKAQSQDNDKAKGFQKNDLIDLVYQGYIGKGFNLTKEEKKEIESYIRELNYSKLYSNKKMDSHEKTMYISIYIRKKRGRDVRIGINPFCKEYGLDNDKYKVISENIELQVPDA